MRRSGDGPPFTMANHVYRRDFPHRTLYMQNLRIQNQCTPSEMIVLITVHVSYFRSTYLYYCTNSIVILMCTVYYIPFWKLGFIITILGSKKYYIPNFMTDGTVKNTKYF